jgi:hypothetical protein
VRNGGASGCGLLPSLPVAWQREQFFVTSTSPLLVRSFSAAKACAANKALGLPQVLRAFGALSISA